MRIKKIIKSTDNKVISRIMCIIMFVLEMCIIASVYLLPRVGSCGFTVEITTSKL